MIKADIIHKNNLKKHYSTKPQKKQVIVMHPSKENNYCYAQAVKHN
jgi:hypothetical protein